MTKFDCTVGRSIKQRYMSSVMCGRSTYKLTWEEIVLRVKRNQIHFAAIPVVPRSLAVRTAAAG
jgi:hypothetical protein